jgi:hypothetical protein
MQQAPNLGYGFHVRTVATSTALFFFDTAFVAFAAYSVHVNGPSIQLLFGFEVRG